MNPLELFLDTIRSNHTQRAYRTDLRSFFGTTDVQLSTIQGVTPGEIDAYHRKGEKAGRSQSALNRRRAALNRFFDEMAERGVIEFNPARHPRVRRPRSKQRASKRPALPGGSTEQEEGTREEGPDEWSTERLTHEGPISSDPASENSLSLKRALSRDAVERLIEQIPLDTEKGRRDLMAVLLCILTGLRRSDIVKLRTSHVYRINRYCIIQYQNKRIALTGAIAELIESIGASSARVTSQGRPLITSVSNRNYGHPVTGSALYRMIRETGDRITEHPVTPDTLRLTGARLASSSGASIQAVRIHLGHQPTDDHDRDARRRHRLKDSASLRIDVGEQACRDLLRR